MSDWRVHGAEDYDDLHPGEAWGRICERTGIQHTTTKVGSEFDWQDFAALAEATIGIALHERAVAIRKLHDTDSGEGP